jgi:hypothetical protein
VVYAAAMASDFPFVQIPAKAAKFFGTKDRDTRVYRREGTDAEIEEWFDKVTDVAGPTVSPGGVCMFAHVSRAAVYKAINEGRLTAFGFHVVKESRSVFGFKRRVRELPYVYIPVSESKAWGQVIKDKAEAKLLTREEEPGWVSDSEYYKLEDGLMRGKYPKRKQAEKKRNE